MLGHRKIIKTKTFTDEKTNFYSMLAFQLFLFRNKQLNW